MNDVPNGGGAEDFLRWAIPGEHAVLDAVEESAGLPKELLARSRAKLRRRSRACCSTQRAPALGCGRGRNRARGRGRVNF